MAGQTSSDQATHVYGLHSLWRFLEMPPILLFQSSAVTFMTPCSGDIHAMGQRVGIVKLCKLRALCMLQPPKSVIAE